MMKKIPWWKKIFENTFDDSDMKSFDDSDHIDTKKDGSITTSLEHDDIRKLKRFLQDRGIEIKSIPEKDEADPIINSLSKLLGNNYDELKNLLKHIKRKQNQGGSFSFVIKDYSQKAIGNICQFCTRLHEIAFLEKYKYFKSPEYRIHAKTTALPLAQNFFSGMWLERFVLLSVQEVVNQISRELNEKLKFTYLLNPKVVLDNGDAFEFDMIFLVNDSFYWIEAKSGDYQQHINKYSRISRILNLNSNNSIMVLTDITPDKAQELTALFSMTVIPLSQLKEVLVKTVKKDQTT